MKYVRVLLILLPLIFSCKKEEISQNPLPPKVYTGNQCWNLHIHNVVTSGNQSIEIGPIDCGAGSRLMDGIWIEHTSNSNVYVFPNGITIYSSSPLTISDPQLNLQLSILNDSIYIRDSTNVYGTYFY